MSHVTADSMPRTLLVAGGVALICSAIVSTAVHYLRPMQVGLDLLQRNRAILAAADMLPVGEDRDRDVATRYLQLDARVVDLDTGWYVDELDGRSYDHWRERIGAEQPDDDAPASSGKGRYAPVYLVKKKADVERIILPIDGSGMWSTIYGYVALGEDLNTITGVTFHRHEETPGIGDRIQDEAWLSTWRGKRIRDDDGALQFRVVKGASGPFEVDVVSGASVTTEATGNIVRAWLGDDGFGPYLERLEKERR